MGRRTFTVTAVVEADDDEDGVELLKASRIAVEQALNEALPDGAEAKVYVLVQP